MGRKEHLLCPHDQSRFYEIRGSTLIVKKTPNKKNTVFIKEQSSI